MAQAFQLGMTVEQDFELTKMDPWYLRQLEALVQELNEVPSLDQLSDQRLRALKARGFSDAQLAVAFGVTETELRELSWKRGVRLRADADHEQAPPDSAATFKRDLMVACPWGRTRATPRT